jgi:hypothetical protein
MAKKRTRSRKRSKSRTPRRRRTAKKPLVTTVKRKTKASPTMSSFQVLKNPFSNATEHPKVPDGGCTHSLSRRMQNVNEIAIKAGEPYMYVVLHPSLGIGCSVYGHANSNNWNYYGYPNHDVGFDITSMATAGRRGAVNQSGISKWRLISQGLRLELINAAEENDGWWEAIRLANPHDATNHWALSQTNNDRASQNEVGMCIREGGSFKSYLDGITFADGKGYATGLLKDLHKHEFKLNPCSDEIPLIDLQTNFAVDAGGAGVGSMTITSGQGEFIRVDGDTKAIYDALLDSSHDMVVLKLHCRPNTETLPLVNGSRFILNTISNQEYCFHPDSNLAHFMTKTLKDKNTSTVIAKMSDNNTAHKPRSGG